MKHDVKFWWLQSVTAFLSIPLFLYFLICIFSDFSDIDTVDFIGNHIFLLSVLFSISLYHGTLGVQVILEDYISPIVLRRVCIAGLYTLSALTGLALFFIIVAILNQ